MKTGLAVAVVIGLLALAAGWYLGSVAPATPLKSVTATVTFVEEKPTSPTLTPSQGSLKIVKAFIARTRYGDIVVVYACYNSLASGYIYINGVKSQQPIIVYPPRPLPHTSDTCYNTAILAAVKDGKVYAHIYLGARSFEDLVHGINGMILEYLEKGEKFDRLTPPVKVKIVLEKSGESVEKTVDKVVEVKEV